MSKYITLPTQARDITGLQSGRLTAQGPVGKSKDGNIMWLCSCVCGKEKVVRSTYIIRGLTQSCGCLQREIASHALDTTTHGMSCETIYYTWSSIKNRCLDLNCAQFAGYGGRGIAVHEEWKHSFEKFFEYVSALPHYGKPGRSLDRIDNNGNYEPGNLRWSTAKEQQRNTRCNHNITFMGRTQCLAAWAEEIGLNTCTLWSRIKRGWSAERALTTPAKPYHRSAEFEHYLPSITK